MAKTYETREEREEYADRLCKRVSSLIAQEAPPGIGKKEATWERIAPADIKAMKMLNAFIDGRATKEEADAACLGVLAAWREQFALGRRVPSGATTE